MVQSTLELTTSIVYINYRIHLQSLLWDNNIHYYSTLESTPTITVHSLTRIPTNSLQYTWLISLTYTSRTLIYIPNLLQSMVYPLLQSTRLKDALLISILEDHTYFLGDILQLNLLTYRLTVYDTYLSHLLQS